MKEFVGLKAKLYASLMNNGSEMEKAKGTKKKCIIKRILKFNDSKDCNFNNKTILK